MKRMTSMFLLLTLLNVEARNFTIKYNYVITPESSLQILSIIKHESNFNDKIVNEKEDAVGVLQIRPVMIKEVNSIQNKVRYKLSDRYSIKKSIEIYRIFQSKHNKLDHFETACRIWNGGQGGMNKGNTIKYYETVYSYFKVYKNKIHIRKTLIIN